MIAGTGHLGECKWCLHRPEGLPSGSGSGSAFTRLPRTPSSLGDPPKDSGGGGSKAGPSLCLLVERNREAPVFAPGAPQ